jgi:hypothetical protein
VTKAYAVVTIRIPLDGTDFNDTEAVAGDKKMTEDAFRPAVDAMGATLSVKVLPDNTEVRNAA